MAAQVIRLAVVGHPARLERAVSLAADVGAELFLDTAGLGEWGNHARAWDWLAGSGASWGVVLQDDAVPVPGFGEHLAELLGAVPFRTAVGLYVGTSYPWLQQARVPGALQRADRVGAAWLASPGLHWGVGVALPVEYIRGVLERPCGRPYDERVGEYFWREHRLPTLYPSWSLVDHEDGPTLVDHGAARTRPRRAHRVGLGPVNGRVVSL